MELSKIVLNENNPRFIRDEKFDMLVLSILKFPTMLSLRPIVLDELNVALGGNMRTRALLFIYNLESIESFYSDKGIALTTLPIFFKIQKTGKLPTNWVKIAKDLTGEQKLEFILKDNSEYGNWDFDALSNLDVSDLDIDVEALLQELDLDKLVIPGEVNVQDYVSKNKEIDVNDFSDKMTLKLAFDSGEYIFVRDALSKLNANSELAILNLLGYEA